MDFDVIAKRDLQADARRQAVSAECCVAGDLLGRPAAPVTRLMGLPAFGGAAGATRRRNWGSGRSARWCRRGRRCTRSCRSVRHCHGPGSCRSAHRQPASPARPYPPGDDCRSRLAARSFAPIVPGADPEIVAATAAGGRSGRRCPITVPAPGSPVLWHFADRAGGRDGRWLPVSVVLGEVIGHQQTVRITRSSRQAISRTT